MNEYTLKSLYERGKRQLKRAWDEFDEMCLDEENLDIDSEEAGLYLIFHHKELKANTEKITSITNRLNAMRKTMIRFKKKRDSQKLTQTDVDRILKEITGMPNKKQGENE